MKDKPEINIENKIKKLPDQLDIDSFRNYIDTTEHKYLTAQPGICFAIVARIYKRVLNNYYFGGIKIDGNMIVDGNHRYIAYMLAKIDFEIINGTRSYCDNVKKINEISIDVNQDWDANNPKTEKYCNDDFLKDGKYLRKG